MGLDASDIFTHTIIIAIEWGVLHSTPLGPLLTGIFSSGWEALGFEFMPHVHDGALALGGSGVDHGHLHGPFEAVADPGGSLEAGAASVVAPASSARDAFGVDVPGDPLSFVPHYAPTLAA